MWIELGVLATGFLGIMGCFIYIKILQSRLDTSRARESVAIASAKSHQYALQMIEKADDAIKTVHEQRTEKHHDAQARIDAGERNDFDTDDF
ncbi:hypothetical protein [Methylomicrobium agile]|uniref:hypothetical protein n=1 Tax=Methylomicrobium agile TaxID=39774 RepID=UPI0004DF1CBB|nr:hypothetical protein [Methylomicrobium agile]